MSLQHRIPWLLAAVVTSVAAMVSGAQSGVPSIVVVAALLYALAIIATAVEVNRPLWRLDGVQVAPDAASVALRRNLRLLVLVYGWGAAAMFAVYGLSGIRWQHGWQYGSVLALIALLFLLYVHTTGGEDGPLRTRRALMIAQKLTVLHGAAAIAGLGYLIMTGKMASTKADWAGSVIFFAGSLAVAGLCLIAAITQSKIAGASESLGPAGSDTATGS
jgi:hypothetical protein